MKFSEIYKKGYGKPDATDILEGGLCIDIKDQRAYSKGEDGTVFALGLTKEEIIEWLSGETTVVPIGGIIMYSGQISAIPVGWVICNGSNGTPDLRNKFVMGTNIQSDMNSTGGSADQKVPSHKHSVTGHNHEGTNGFGGLTDYEEAHTHGGVMEYTHSGPNGEIGSPDLNVKISGTSSSAGGHSHNVSLNWHPAAYTTTIGEDATNMNLPPYVKLAYIMRKS